VLVQTFGRLRAESENHRAVRFERVYDYRPDELWAAITEPAQIRGWLGEADVELREGGDGTLKLDDQMTARLRVRQLEPGRFVEYDWDFPNEPPSILRLEVEARGEGTLLVLDHRRLASEDAAEYGAGWHSHLDALELMLAGRSHDWQDRFNELHPAYRDQAAGVRADARLGELRSEGERRGVRYVRFLPAPPAEVWRALTEPQQVGVWMDGVATVEPKAGGAFEIVWSDRERWSGLVRVWDPPRVLEVTWDEDDAGAVVRFELEEADGATRLVLDHRGLPAAEIVSVGAGWHSHLDWLDAHLAARSDFDFWPRWRELAPTYTDLAASV
jgi:uncharacterized protein YndB with AHSA1/START domain